MSKKKVNIGLVFGGESSEHEVSILSAKTIYNALSYSKENKQLVLRLKVPYNYFDLDDFELKAIELLGIDSNWVINMSLENLKCTHSLKKQK